MGFIPDLFLFSQRYRRRLILAAILWFAGWLLALAPAQLAARLLQRALPQLELAAVEGSCWNGSARQAFINLGNQRLALGRLDWQLNSWSLLWLHPSAHIATQWGDQMLDAQLRVGPMGVITLRDTRALFPVELAKLWLPVPARGVIGLNLQSAVIQNRLPQNIVGEIQWQRAQWQWGDRWLSLGDYRLQLHSENTGELRGEISGEGDLASTGTLQFDPVKRAYQIDAKLSASRGLPQEFRDSLVFLLNAKPVENSEQGAGAPLLLQLQRNGAW